MATVADVPVHVHAPSDRPALRRVPDATRVLVALADDAEALTALADDPALAVVGRCAPRDAPAAVAAHAPEVLLLGADLRADAGRRLVRDVLTVSARVRVVILSAVRDPLALVEALGAGASGYLLSTGPRTARALHEVMDGRVPIDPRLTELLRDRLGPATASGAGTAARLDRLTPRENTVLGLVALGLTNEQIARELVLSTGTVKLHVQHVIHKLGVANRTQAAVHAARLGLLPPSS